MTNGRRQFAATVRQMGVTVKKEEKLPPRPPIKKWPRKSEIILRIEHVNNRRHSIEANRKPVAAFVPVPGLHETEMPDVVEVEFVAHYLHLLFISLRVEGDDRVRFCEHGFTLGD